MRELIGEIEGAEACVEAVEAQHEFLINRAGDMDPEMLVHEATG